MRMPALPFAPGGRLGNVELNTRYNICGSKLLQDRNVKDSVAFPFCWRFPSVTRKRDGNYFVRYCNFYLIKTKYILIYQDNIVYRDKFYAVIKIQVLPLSHSPSK